MYNTALSTTHKVGLRNLTSDCTYYYQTCLNVDGECARSEVLSFKSAVSPGLTGEEFKFAVLGDMGVMGPLGGCSRCSKCNKVNPLTRTQVYPQKHPLKSTISLDLTKESAQR